MTARRGTSPPACSAWLDAAAGALLPEPRRHLPVAPGAAAAPRRAADRRARLAGRPASWRAGAGRRRQRRRAFGEGARSRLAPARVRPQKGGAARPRWTARELVAAGYEVSTRSRTAASSRSGAGCSTCFPRPRTGPSGSTCSARDRVAAVVLDVHAAIAGRRRAGRGRARRRARRGASRAGRDRRPRGGRRPAGHRRAAAGGELPLVPGARSGRCRGLDLGRGGCGAGAGRPLAGRDRGLPR